MSFTKQLNRVRLDEVISALLLVIAKKWEVWLTAAAEADLVGEWRDSWTRHGQRGQWELSPPNFSAGQASWISIQGGFTCQQWHIINTRFCLGYKCKTWASFWLQTTKKKPNQMHSGWKSHLTTFASEASHIYFLSPLLIDYFWPFLCREDNVE